MRLPNSSFPNTIPVQLFKSYTPGKRPSPVATLLVPYTEVSQEEVVYSLREKRFHVEIRVGIGKDGSAVRIKPEDISYRPNLKVEGANELQLKVNKVVKEFNAPAFSWSY